MDGTGAKVELAIVNGTEEMKEKMTDEIADLGGKVETGFLAGAKQAAVDTLKSDLGKVREDIVGTQVDNVEKKVDNLSTQVDNLDTRVVNLDKKVENGFADCAKGKGEIMDYLRMMHGEGAHSQCNDQSDGKGDD